VYGIIWPRSVEFGREHYITVAHIYTDGVDEPMNLPESKPRETIWKSQETTTRSHHQEKQDKNCSMAWALFHPTEEEEEVPLLVLLYYCS
jgi:hypothetical protein